MGSFFQLPGEPRTRDAAINRWGSAVNKALAALLKNPTVTRIEPTIIRSGVTRPFAITYSFDDPTWTATVATGNGYRLEFAKDSDDLAMPCMETIEFNPLIESGLADNTDYGFWLYWDISWNSINAFDKPTGFGETIGQANATNQGIVMSSNFDAKTDLTGITASTQNKAYMWLGKLQISGGVATVIQGLKENVTLHNPSILLAASVVSTDAENDISKGSDSLAYYKDDENTRDAGEQ